MSDFCRGYHDGYRQAFCHHGLCDSVRPPYCPVPEARENDYQSGFKRGLLDGLAAQ